MPRYQTPKEGEIVLCSRADKVNAWAREARIGDRAKLGNTPAILAAHILQDEGKVLTFHTRTGDFAQRISSRAAKFIIACGKGKFS